MQIVHIGQWSRSIILHAIREKEYILASGVVQSFCMPSERKNTYWPVESFNHSACHPRERIHIGQWSRSIILHAIREKEYILASGVVQSFCMPSERKNTYWPVESFNQRKNTERIHIGQWSRSIILHAIREKEYIHDERVLNQLFTHT